MTENIPMNNTDLLLDVSSVTANDMHPVKHFRACFKRVYHYVIILHSYTTVSDQSSMYSSV